MRASGNHAKVKNHRYFLKLCDTFQSFEKDISKKASHFPNESL